MTLGIDIVDAARRYEKVPFCHQGRSKKKGIDCAGLLICVAHDLGLSDFDITGYARLPVDNTMESLLDKNLIRINLSDVFPGDILFFELKGSMKHLAIITRINPYYIIHAYEPNAKVIEHRLDSVWKRILKRVYRFPRTAWQE